MTTKRRHFITNQSPVIIFALLTLISWFILETFIWFTKLFLVNVYSTHLNKYVCSPAAVVVTFFLCWAPYHAQRLYYFYGRGSDYYYVVNEWLYYLAGCFYYFSATANPLLYNLMSVKYRDGFRHTFCGQKRREYSSISRERQQSLCNPARLQQVWYTHYTSLKYVVSRFAKGEQWSQTMQWAGIKDKSELLTSGNKKRYSKWRYTVLYMLIEMQWCCGCV